MFMSWDLYFANWKRTETMSLLIKIASLLIGNAIYLYFREYKRQTSSNWKNFRK